MVRAHGFSLIELLVTLALLAFLLMLAVPFTSAWSSSAKLRDTENLLLQGAGRAKALAQRNHYGMTGNQVAARLCFDSQELKLQLYQASSSDEASCSGTPIWSAAVPQGATIKDGSTDFACLAMDSRGLLLAKDSCSTTTSYTLEVGSENVVTTII
ncbi:prepilin-type N-terminal cleavage/methylation domain-containing protein [Pseudomonas sp. LRF_L74]|uniref:prepilin-type N-terminal cleavage/methylation domain-containing protein n=1 Tax=Pseudomonas sp. LRF_L74 TaxID=3369422 RepID=UPI003F62587D